MEYRIVETEPTLFLECLPEGGKITSERDAVDLVGACGENGVDRLLFYANNLTDDFYNLRTRLAGDVLQKFINYHIISAVVLTPELVGNGRFSEMVWEANRGRQFHVAYDREEAVKWLTKTG